MKFLKTHLNRFSAAMAAIAFFLAVGAQAAPAALHVSGNKLQTASGCSVTFKGVNVDGLEFSSTGEGPTGGNGGNTLAVAQMAVTGWHSTIIRLPLNQDYWFGCQGANQTNYQNIISGIVNYCSGQGVYVILDLHWSGQSSTATAPCGSGWGAANAQHQMADANAVTFWSSVAAAYANNPAVIFDLYNEPYDSGNDNINPPVTDTTGYNTWLKGGTLGGASFSTPGMQALLNAVRSAGATNVCLMGGLHWCANLNGLPASSVTNTGAGVMFATHLYGNNDGTSSSSWNAEVPSSLLSGYPVFAGEYGPSTSCNTDDSTFDNNIFAWLSSTAGIVGGTAWSMHPSSCPNLLADWSFNPSTWGTAEKNFLATPWPTCSAGSPVPTSTPTWTGTPTRTFTPTPTTVPPNITLTKTTGGPTSGYSDAAPITMILNVCNSSGSVTANSVTVSDNITNPLSWAFQGPGYSPWIVTVSGAPVSINPTGTTYPNLSWVVSNLPGGSCVPITFIVGSYSFNASDACQVVSDRGIAQWPGGGPVTSNTIAITVVCLTPTPTPSNTPLAPTNTPTSTATRTNTSTFTPTFTATSTPSRTNTPTGTPTLTPTKTVTPTNSPSSTPSNTPVPPTNTPTMTPTQTFTKTNSPSATPTNTSSNTFTNTSTPSFTSTATASSTATRTFTLSNTPTASPTNSPVPPTSTPSATSTHTATRTNTATSTMTGTPTLTHTNTASSTPTITPTWTPSPTGTLPPTNTPTSTGTNTFTPTSTPTFTFTSTLSSTSSRTSTATPSNTATNTRTATATLTPTSSFTPTNTFTLTATSTLTRTPSSTPTATLANTATHTPTRTATSSSTNSATSSATLTVTSSATRTATSTATSTATNTGTPTITYTQTNSPTGTLSPTLTPTPTSTPTLTGTNTFTSTFTNTATPTSSFTHTPTLTSTFTATNSASFTPTSTFTASSTPTATSANTATPTPTHSATSTSSRTASPTATQTAANTATRTPTPTWSNTSTSTRTPTASSTPTLTPTLSPTAVTIQVLAGSGAPSGSQLQGAVNVPVDQVILTNTSPSNVTMTSMTVTENGNPSGNILSVTLLKNGVPDGPSQAFSGSTVIFMGLNDTVAAGGGSVTYTVQVTFSGTASAGNYSFSVTGASGTNGQPVNFNGLPLAGATVTIAAATATPTISSTPTRTGTPTPFEKDKPVLYPDPSDGSPVQVLPPFFSGTSDLKVEIFTVAFRKVREDAYSNQTYGTLTLELKDRFGTPLASGLYYVVVQTNKSRSVGKLLILR